MSTIAPKPQWAPSVWKNSAGEIFAQFEEGHVLKFSPFEAGLTKLLKIIPTVESQPGYLSGGANISDRVLRPRAIRVAKSTERKRELAKVSAETRSKARDVVRRNLANIKETK